MRIFFVFNRIMPKIIIFFPEFFNNNQQNKIVLNTPENDAERWHDETGLK